MTTQFLIGTALGVLINATSLFAGDGAKSISHYDLISKGLRVGSVETTRERVERDGESLVRCEVRTEVSVNLLLYRRTKLSREVSWSDESGIVEYELGEDDDGVMREAKGALRDGVFHFDIVEDGKARTVDIPRADYEYVTQEAPEQQLETPGDSRTFRILSVGSFEVVDRTFTLLKMEKVAVNGVTTECKVVDFSDVHKTGRRWFTADDLGLCIYRQDGRDKGSKYSLRMTSNKRVSLPVALAR